MNIWEKYYKQVSIGSNSAFQKAFHNLSNDQLTILREKFEILQDKYTQPHEFALIVALSAAMQANLEKNQKMSEHTFAKLIQQFPERPGLSLIIKQMLAIYEEIDYYNSSQVNWNQFSQAVQIMSKNNQQQVSNSMYYPHQHYIPLLSKKITDPIYNITYSQKSKTFCACCKDNNIYQLNSQGKVLKTLKGGHQSLPLSCISVHPYVENLYEYSANSTLNFFNYISSGADRKIVMWNTLGQPVSYVTTYNIIYNLAAYKSVIYRGQIVQPAIFGGDDAGNVNFYMLDGQHFKILDQITKQRMTFAEEEDSNIRINQLYDDDIEQDIDDVKEEVEENEESENENQTPDHLMRKQQRFEQQRRQQEIQQKLQHATQQAKMSPTPIWSCKAHDGWSSSLMIEHMKDSDDYLLVSGGTDGSLVRIDIDSGTICTKYIGHTGPISGVAWMHNRGLMLSVGKDRQLNVWPSALTTSTVYPIAKFINSDQPYIGVFASKTNQEFFTVDVTGSVKQWDVRKLQPIATIIGNQQRNGKACCAAYDEIDGSIAVGSNVVGITQKQNQNQQIQISLNSIQRLVTSDTVPGALIAADNKIQFWDLLKGKQTHDFDQILYTNPDSNNLGQVIGQIDNHEQLGQNILQQINQPFSSDKYGQIQLENLKQIEQEQPNIEQYENGEIFVEKQVNDIAISPNNQLFVICCEDGEVSIHQSQNGSELFRIRQGDEEIGNIPEQFRETNQVLQQQKHLIEKERAKLQFVTENESIIGREDYKAQRTAQMLNKQKYGACSNAYFGINPGKLYLWLCYAQTNSIVCYLINERAQNKYHSVGKYVSKFTWKETTFLINDNLLGIHDGREINIVQQDGSLLCRCLFSTDSGDIRFIQGIEDVLFVFLINENKLYIRLLDAHCFVMIAEALIEDLTAEQLLMVRDARANLYNDSIMLVFEDGGVVVYKIEGFYQLHLAYQQLIIQNPNTDCKVALQIEQNNYTCVYTTRRPYIMVGELKDEFEKFGGQQLVQAKQKANGDRNVQSLMQQEYIIVKPKRLHLHRSVRQGEHYYNLSELCLLKITVSKTTGLYMISTGLGQVLVFCANTGEFLQFISFGGWEEHSQARVRKLIREQQPTFLVRQLCQKHADAEAKAMRVANLISGEALCIMGKGNPPPKTGASERERQTAMHLAELFYKESQGIKAKPDKTQTMKQSTTATLQKSIQSKDVRAISQKASQLLQDTENVFRSVSESPQLRRKLTAPITRDTARERLAAALAAADAEVARGTLNVNKAKKLLPRAPSPLRQARNNSIENLPPSSQTRIRPVAATILTMPPDDIRKRFGEEAFAKYKPGAVLKKPTRVHWGVGDE